MKNDTPDIALRGFIKKFSDSTKYGLKFETFVFLRDSILSNKKAITQYDLDLLLN